jgi:hypothetical protein
VELAVSWNGATRVSSWRVLEGSSANRLRPVLSSPRGGFETTFSVPLRGRFFAAQALDRGGAVLGTSPTLRG